jgi:hypothetical protein
LADAFLLSIDHFNEGNEGQLKYVWPYYLPSTSTAACSFLKPAIKSILTRLEDSHVLESCAGTMVKPSSLKHVPLGPFTDGEGIPFTLCPHTEASYLSLKYPPWAIEEASSIGVSQLSPKEFLGDLNSAITDDPTTFRTRSATWHSQLAGALVKLSTDEELMSMIQDLCLIPLHDGNWTSARGQSMFFSKSETSLEIPSGIKVLIVDSTAESDTNRRKLFTSLGVKAWEAPEICRLVLRTHESSDFDPKSLTVDQLISHVAFLYNASWQPPKTADLWFATMQNERCLGRKLYIPGSIKKNSSAASIFAQLQKQFAVIHNDYLKAFALDADWPMWLISNLGLSKVPRLITPHVDPKPEPIQTLKIGENPTATTLTFSSGDQAFKPAQARTLAAYQQNLPQQNLGQMPRPSGAPGGGGNHALQDYQMQLILLERQNKKRLMMARQEPDQLQPAQNYDATAQLSRSKAVPPSPNWNPTDDTQSLEGQKIPLTPAATAANAVANGLNVPVPGQIPQPTPQDSMKIRNHPSGKTAQASEVESRDVLTTQLQIYNQMNPKQIQQQRIPTDSQIRASGLSPLEQWFNYGDGPWNPIAGKEKIPDNANSKDTPAKLTLSPPFALSEEFTFMFRECQTSDILQLLRDNWNHYSQWINGAHMKWQDTNFLESSSQLRNSLRACLVQCAKGFLPLQETVLPMIDPQLDEGRLIPAVDIKDPQHPEWSLLSYFGVIMKGDVHYYLRCLITISEENCPDVDSVAYIYEKIQSRYKGNEELIWYVFRGTLEFLEH